MNSLLLVNVKYIGPTDHRGARIKMSLPRFEESLTIPYNYEARDAEDGAVKYLASKGLVPIARACGEDCAHILFDFENADALFAFFRK